MTTRFPRPTLIHAAIFFLLNITHREYKRTYAKKKMQKRTLYCPSITASQLGIPDNRRCRILTAEVCNNFIREGSQQNSISNWLSSLLHPLHRVDSTHAEQNGDQRIAKQKNYVNDEMCNLYHGGELLTNSLFLINVKVHHVHRRQQLDPIGQCFSICGTRLTVDIFSRLGRTRGL